MLTLRLESNISCVLMTCRMEGTTLYSIQLLCVKFVRLLSINRLLFMNNYLQLGKISFGMGDRFGHQGRRRNFQACIRATELGAEVIPVWNKSNREHTFVGTEPLQPAGQKPMPP